MKNAAKAIIVMDNRLLLNKFVNTLGDVYNDVPAGAVFYDLPGGGQKNLETLTEAVTREVLEETGHKIKTARLAALYEEISINEAFFKEFGFYSHKIFFIFVAEIFDGPPEKITNPDYDMLGSEWVDLNGIGDFPLYPITVRKNIKKIIDSNEIIFLGSERGR